MIINYDDLQNKINSLEIKKTPKSFLQILDKSYNEVIISKYLEYLLDERNTNRSIIQGVLSKTSCDESVDFIDLLKFATFEGVQTEEQISQQSRLDIVIKYSNFWIVIENKIFAYESKENQTHDYERQIKQFNTNKLPIKFIYLKPKFNKSTPSNLNFKELLYDDLADIFKGVDEKDLNDHESYLYLKDFIKHVEGFLMNDNKLIDEKALEFYLENKQKLDYIINAYKQQSLSIRKLVVDSISNRFPTYKVHDTTSYIQIFKDNWENRGSTGIHFEILANTNWDSLLGSRTVKLRFVLHNEKNTKNKYPDIVSQSLYTKEFMFNNNENIQKSIQLLLEDIQYMINRFEKDIDTKIMQKNSKG